MLNKMFFGSSVYSGIAVSISENVPIKIKCLCNFNRQCTIFKYTLIGIKSVKTLFKKMPINYGNYDKLFLKTLGNGC